MLCSIAFLLMYTAIYSAQNVQAVLYELDEYGSLGFYSNACVYLGEGVGSIFCVYLTTKYGESKSMSRAALLSMPFLVSLLLPAYRSLDLHSESVWLSDPFVYSIVLFASLLNGLGGGVS